MFAVKERYCGISLYLLIYVICEGQTSNLEDVIANSDIKNATYPLVFQIKGMFAVKERKCMMLEGYHYIH